MVSGEKGAAQQRPNATPSVSLAKRSSFKQLHEEVMKFETEI